MAREHLDPGRLVKDYSCSTVSGMKVALRCFPGECCHYTGVVITVQYTSSISSEVMASFTLTLSAPLPLFSLNFL